MEGSGSPSQRNDTVLGLSSVIIMYHVKCLRDASSDLLVLYKWIIIIIMAAPVHNTISSGTCHHYNMQDELSIDDSLLLKGERLIFLVVP